MIEYDENLEEFRQQVRAVMENQEMNISPENAPLIEETLMKIERENLTLKEALDLSEDLMENIYDHGYHLFQGGKYEEALPVFHLLRQLESTDPRFTFAIAASHHKAKHYAKAVGNYMLYELLDSTNPLPYYHLYDCFKNLNQPLLASNALKLAHRLAEQDPQYSLLKGNIEVELNYLKSLKKSSVT